MREKGKGVLSEIKIIFIFNFFKAIFSLFNFLHQQFINIDLILILLNNQLRKMYSFQQFLIIF